MTLEEREKARRNRWNETERPPDRDPEPKIWILLLVIVLAAVFIVKTWPK